MRDVRINLIIEGTSDIMHLFIAREALDPHLGKVLGLLSPSGKKQDLLKALSAVVRYYSMWYPRLWLPSPSVESLNHLGSPLREHMFYVQKASRRLARDIFHQMMIYQKKLESKQSLLNRIVDIGTDLFAMAAACSYADSLVKEGTQAKNSVYLADVFCREARKRIESQFHDVHRNADKAKLKLAKSVLKEEFSWLENDIIKS